MQLAVDAAAAAAAALRCVATANRGGGKAVQRWQSDPTSASVLREVLAAAAQQAVAFLRQAERCRALPLGVARRLPGVTADAEPVLPAGGAPPAGSSKTARRAAQRRRRRLCSAAAAAAKPPQAAPAKVGDVSGAAERQPPAGGPRSWAAAVAAPPSALRTAAPGRPLSPPDFDMGGVRSAGTASAAPPIVFGAGSGGSRPPQRRFAGRTTQGRAQPAAAAMQGRAATAAAAGDRHGGRTGERVPAQRTLGTTSAAFRIAAVAAIEEDESDFRWEEELGLFDMPPSDESDY